MPKKIMETASHGLVNSVYQEGSRITSVRHQPGRRKVLEQNAADREGGHRKSDFMRPMARFDHEAHETLKAKYPDAMRGDTRAMERFLNTSEGRKYSLTKRGASRAFVWMGGKHGR